MKHLQVATIATILVFGAAVSFPAYAASSDDPSRFIYTRIYCTPEGVTHFKDVTVELSKNDIAPPAAPVYIGGKLPASVACFGGFEPVWGSRDLENRLNHPGPAALFATILRGKFSITTTDGDKRQFSPGDMVRVEDNAPCKGHITVAGDKAGFLMFAR